MPAKRGRLSQDEREYILIHAAKMTPEEIAAHLNRTVDTVREYSTSRGVTTMDPRDYGQRSEKMAIRAGLRTSQKWGRLQEELTKDEISFFEEEYVKLKGQFRDDVLPSEETQVFDCIKFEILKSRNMAERKRARDEISILEDKQAAFMAQFRDDIRMSDEQQARALNLDTQLQASRMAEQNRTREYVQLQERHDALMKSLKSTRDQRIREVESGKETILGLLKLLKNKETQAAEGREMELMRLAAEKEYGRLGSLHEYEDGGVDRPILSCDTVASGQEDEVE